MFKRDRDPISGKRQDAFAKSELEKHPHWRRKSPQYAAKRRYVRDLWIYSGLLIIFLPLSVQIISVAALGFLSLSVLDDEGSREDEG